MTGSGTALDPYIIYDVNDLQAISLHMTAGTYYQLANDIDASATSGWNGGAGFIPIGSQTQQFKGNFDGKGHVIKNLFINDSTDVCVGLFGWGRGSVMQNVGLVGGSVTATGIPGNPDISIAGALVASLDDNSDAFPVVVGFTVRNCYSTMMSVSGGAIAGGLIGQVIDDIAVDTVTKCYSTSNVHAVKTRSPYSGYAGGFIGSTSQCTGDIHGNPLITISDCYSTGNVIADGSASEGSAGGFITSLGTILIENCYARGNATAPTDAGGFGTYGQAIFTNCYSTGTATGTNAGGFTAGSDVATFNNCFWDSQLSGNPTSGGGTPENSVAMKTKGTFTGVGWDFVNTWALCFSYNNGYPNLDGVNCSQIIQIQKPVVSTLAATGITEEQAVLNGHVDNDGGAPGQVAFQYGALASYGMQTPFQNSGFVTGDSFSAQITGLSSGQQYHCRALFQTQDGTIVYGQDIAFSTLPAEGGMVLLDEDLQMILMATEDES